MRQDVKLVADQSPQAWAAQLGATVANTVQMQKRAAGWGGIAKALSRATASAPTAARAGSLAKGLPKGYAGAKGPVLQNANTAAWKNEVATNPRGVGIAELRKSPPVPNGWSYDPKDTVGRIVTEGSGRGPGTPMNPGTTMTYWKGQRGTPVVSPQHQALLRDVAGAPIRAKQVARDTALRTAGAGAAVGGAGYAANSAYENAQQTLETPFRQREPGETIRPFELPRDLAGQ
jgi:hypothetical protein